MNELWQLWKKSVNWEKQSQRQKLICLWFSLSFISLVLCGENFFLAILVLVNFACASRCVVNNVTIPEE